MGLKDDTPYGNPNYYFSASQQRWVSVADLPLPYIVNILRKNLQEEGFKGSPLFNTLRDRLCPDRALARIMLAGTGQSTYYCPHKVDETAVRSFYYSIGRTLHTKVSTHRNGDFIEATCEPTGDVVHVNFKKNNRFIGSGS